MNVRIKSALLGAFLFCLATTANAGGVSKEVWIDAMSSALPTAFCQSHQYFRQCFEVTAIECEDTASSATRICLERYKDKIPNLLKQQKDGNYWGRIIGTCAGQAYEITLQTRRISSKECNDPANWQ